MNGLELNFVVAVGLFQAIQDMIFKDVS